MQVDRRIGLFHPRLHCLSESYIAIAQTPEANFKNLLRCIGLLPTEKYIV